MSSSAGYQNKQDDTVTANIQHRLRDVQRFYDILDRLSEEIGGPRLLKYCSGRLNWPKRGVYFFFEPDEDRTTSGNGHRVVRIGTHALNTGSQTRLWKRLSQHQGTIKGGGGNHRGSVFRHHVGTALINRDNWPTDQSQYWDKGHVAPKEIRQVEKPLERAVSSYIRDMPFLWLKVDDETGPNSMRGYIERNAIALLSNYHFPENPIDPPSTDWLGHRAKSEAITISGLWNVNHVTEMYYPSFLDTLRDYMLII